MPEPERVDEPSEERASGLAAEAVAPAPMTTPEPTYHMGVWDEPPTYICQICNLQGVDKPTIVAHLDTDHGLPAIPTLLAQQVEDGIVTPTLGIVAPPSAHAAPAAQEELSADERRTDGEQPGDAGDAPPGNVSA